MNPMFPIGGDEILMGMLLLLQVFALFSGICLWYGLSRFRRRTAKENLRKPDAALGMLTLLLAVFGSLFCTGGLFLSHFVRVPVWALLEAVALPIIIASASWKMTGWIQARRLRPA